MICISIVFNDIKTARRTSGFDQILFCACLLNFIVILLKLTMLHPIL